MPLLYPIGTSESLDHAVQLLKEAGLTIVDHPTPEVTHVLLDVPNRTKGASLEKILQMLPQSVTVVGGNLKEPVLEGYAVWDLLQDEEYLAKNAAITAECALQVAAPMLKTTLAQSPTLILGWGRIGKYLGKLLRALGCSVTVAARKERDRAMLQALGYGTAEPTKLKNLSPYRILFNTVPAPVMGKEVLSPWKNCVKIDLASRPGLAGDDVVWARGLPGIYTPESSGALIAETILRKRKEEKT